MTPAPPILHRWRAFAVLAVAYFMTIVDLTIVNVALPTIGRELHFSESNLQWVVTAYGLTFGGFLLLGGRAADLLGRKRILMLGLGVFTAASLACALATTDSLLIVMRGVQGLGAAIMLPAALSIVMNMFPEGAERNKALGAWGGHRRQRRNRRTDHGRPAHPLPRLGVHLLSQRPDRRPGAPRLPPRIVPESRLETRRRRYDPFGGLTVTGGLLLHGLRALAGGERRLEQHPHDLALRRRCRAAPRFPDRRDARGGAAAAVPHLPTEDASPARTQSGCCSAPASSPSSSSAPSTCSRCSATRRSRPAWPGSPPRSPRSASPGSRKHSSPASQPST